MTAPESQGGIGAAHSPEHAGRYFATNAARMNYPKFRKADAVASRHTKYLSAKWMLFNHDDKTYIGEWIENGRNYLFRFYLEETE